MTINTKLEPAAAAVARDNNNDDDAAAETYCNSSHHDALEKACCNNNKNSSIHAVTAIKSPAQKQASETYINNKKKQHSSCIDSPSSSLHACKLTPTLPRISCLQYCKWELRSFNIPKQKKKRKK
jgi:hypothetical protein